MWWSLAVAQQTPIEAPVERANDAVLVTDARRRSHAWKIA